MLLEVHTHLDGYSDRNFDGRCDAMSYSRERRANRCGWRSLRRDGSDDRMGFCLDLDDHCSATVDSHSLSADHTRLGGHSDRK